MSKRKKLGWFVLGVFVVLLLEVLAYVIFAPDLSPRSTGAPPGAAVSNPWGAIDIEDLFAKEPSKVQQSITASIRAEGPGQYDPDGDGVKTYDLLALSGGGSYGAYGAGVLCGWTKSGKRPQFKVVTGISAGSLQATFAFLGPKYDDALRTVFTEYDSEEIYERRNRLSGFLGDAMADTAPLAEKLERHMTQEVLKAVAAEHAKGRRLFVGTTNMDTGTFVIWDMGEIAASGRSDALEHYRKVLLASSSVPVFFPPVYFNVEADGKTYREMHADGGVAMPVFFRGFLLDFDDALDDTGVHPSRVEMNLYVIENGKAAMEPYRVNVSPQTLALASAVIQNLLEGRTTASLYRIYTLAHRFDMDFKLAAVPLDYPLDFDILDFDTAKTRKLFDLGYQQAEKGYRWASEPPGLDPDEIVTKPQPSTSPGR